jgi:hypothetical protein
VDKYAYTEDEKKKEKEESGFCPAFGLVLF